MSQKFEFSIPAAGDQRSFITDRLIRGKYMKKYKPNPLQTSAINLPEAMGSLIEDIAKNIHEVWASKRMAEGWITGPVRDDSGKKHPCLVPYEELPESEREYDRATVTETLKSLIALGYRIQPPSIPNKPFHDTNLDHLSQYLKSSEPIFLADLQKIWDAHDPKQWAIYPKLYRLLAERIIKIGEPLLAYDVLSRGLQVFSEKEFSKTEERLAIRLKQLLGLSLAQSGATARAQQILQKLYDQGWRDGETLGILGRTYKDLAMREKDPEIRAVRLEKAFQCYLEAYRTSQENTNKQDAYYTGINAATLALIRGDAEQAEKIAQEVLTICTECASGDFSPSTTDSYWIDASMAEAYLILGKTDAAIDSYQRAVAKAKYNYRDISAMKRQAKLITEHLRLAFSFLEHSFTLPQIGVYLHRPAKDIERSDQEGVQDFSLQLKALNIGIGYVSVSGFQDLLFAEAMLDLPNSELHMVFPFTIEETRHLFDTTDSRMDWPRRFDNVIQKSAKHYELSHICSLGNECNHAFARAFTIGMATLRGRWLNTNVHFLNDQVLSKELEEEIGRGNTCMSVTQEKHQAETPAKASRHIYAMMFADVKNYSNLHENQLLLFAHHFMQHTSQIIQPFSKSLLFKRTTGDGFFFVFDHLSDALDFALSFRTRVSELNWTEVGLPHSLKVRISLDAGPIFSYYDRVAGHMDVCGKYVIRAARLEPITPPGEIYASESFAALAASEGLNQAEFAYAGRICLPKNFGTIPVYHARQS